MNMSGVSSTAAAEKQCNTVCTLNMKALGSFETPAVRNHSPSDIGSHTSVVVPSKVSGIETVRTTSFVKLRRNTAV